MILPTGEAESIARELMQQLGSSLNQSRQGKLYGILLVQSPEGSRSVLKGFSGLLNGHSHHPGWVPPLTVEAQMTIVEAQTLAKLSQLKQSMVTLQHLPERADYDQLTQQYAARLAQLSTIHRQRKQQRDRQRSYLQTQIRENCIQAERLENNLRWLSKESQQDSLERRRLKEERKQALASFEGFISQADRQIRRLKQQYATLSHQWQAQMQRLYGSSLAGIEDGLAPGDLGYEPDCSGLCHRAAAKLLYQAIAQGLTPLAIAEFWWGPPQSGFVSGQFYETLPEDVQALMSLQTLASASAARSLTRPRPITPLSIVYQDDDLIIVDKPAGLLSVPGRRYALQDSVLGRLRYQLLECVSGVSECVSVDGFLQAAHRLDQATSGLLVIACSPQAHAALSQQFAQQQVSKTYEAILSKPIERTSGTVCLSLKSDPENRPKQFVDRQKGKPSRTDFRQLTAGDYPRVEFTPHTGRTHQLRIHAAHAEGLNAPILGDVLYGDGLKRLHLHATSLKFLHPITRTPLQFRSAVPF